MGLHLATARATMGNSRSSARAAKKQLVVTKGKLAECVGIEHLLIARVRAYLRVDPLITWKYLKYILVSMIVREDWLLAQ